MPRSIVVDGPGGKNGRAPPVLSNVPMLVAPAEAVKAWQLGGAPR